eukprot:3208951-Prymnesium_polylepis.1
MVCVSALEAGYGSFGGLRTRLKEVLTSHALPSVGQKAAKTALTAAAMLRCLRDGRDPEKMLKFMTDINDADMEQPKVEGDKALGHMTHEVVRDEWIKFAAANSSMLPWPLDSHPLNPTTRVRIPVRQSRAPRRCSRPRWRTRSGCSRARAR